MGKVFFTSVVVMGFCLIIFVGCGSDDGDTNILSFNSEIAGIWKMTSGNSFSLLNVDDLQYMQFNEDGTVLVVYQNEFNILANKHFLYAVVNENTVAMDFGSMEGMHILSNLFIYDRPDISTLSLTDHLQNTIILTSETQIPSSLFYEEFSDQKEYTDLEIEPDYDTNVVYDGTYLWYEEYNTSTLYPFDPSSGMIVSASAIDMGAAGQYTHIQDYQSGDFWTHCRCGDNDEASRRDVTGSEIDIVDTTNDLGSGIGIDAIAWDGSNLWINGYSSDESKSLLHMVDSDVEPDSLVATYDSTSLLALSKNGSDFWALSNYEGTVIIKFELDSTEISMISTYEVPDNEIEWRGITSVNSYIYLLGEDWHAENSGVIVRLTP